MCNSTEITSIFPVPILYTPIQKINDIYCYNPMFHTLHVSMPYQMSLLKKVC